MVSVFAVYGKVNPERAEEIVSGDYCTGGYVDAVALGIFYERNDGERLFSITCWFHRLKMCHFDTIK